MRKLLVVTMAVVGAVALAAPAGLAAKPFQDRFPVGSSFTIPAGYGCPFGQVGGDGAVYGFVGEVTYTADPETGVFESFSAEGVVTDLCAAVAPT